MQVLINIKKLISFFIFLWNVIIIIQTHDMSSSEVMNQSQFSTKGKRKLGRLDKDGKLDDFPLRPFLYEAEAQVYITGYVDAIVNHTSEADEAKVRGQFSIRNVAGDVVNNNEDDSSTNKETENV